MNKMGIKIIIMMGLIISLVSCKNSKYLNNKNIEYKNLYNGFVIVAGNESLPPKETLVFNSKGEWDKFGRENFPGINGIITMFDKIDFSKECIVYTLTISPRSGYGLSEEIENIFIDNNKLIVKYKTNNTYNIYALNKYIDEYNLKIIHPYINIVKIEKKYIPDDLKNIYVSN
ncbi:MAG: hypothetical protein FH751_15130 [Firmicutes bacterium]|nr:hypothetical protein [Bacillota bacterium]